MDRPAVNPEYIEPHTDLFGMDPIKCDEMSFVIRDGNRLLVDDGFSRDCLLTAHGTCYVTVKLMNPPDTTFRITT